VPIRLVSFLSSIGSIVIIYLIVKRETRSAFPAFIASCLFVATYNLSGVWFDIGRPDSLFLFFCLWSLYILKFSKSTGSYILSGLLLSLSFYTKQTALIISIPIMLYTILIDRRQAVTFILTLAVLIGLGSVVMNYLYDGWFNFYVYELPRTTPIFTRYLVSFWTRDIAMPLFIAVFAAIFYLISEWKVDKGNFLFYILTAAGMLGASWYSRLRGGGFLNVLFPTYAIIAVLFGLGINRLSESIKSFSSDKKNQFNAVIYMLCIFQFGMLAYNPVPLVPSKMDTKAGYLFIEKIKKIDGEVFSPFHGYLTEMAGKKSYANQMGMRDVLTTWNEKHARVKAKLINEIKQAMREREFAAIIIDSFEPWYPPDMEEYYVKKERIFNDETVFFPVTGPKTRPEFIYVPKDNGSTN
jgi:hypothetical protein